MDEMIRIRGARVHNLQNIDVDIPKHQLVVITGLSGSGKSSLAFDTLYAEGQRRYVESLSAYARQFLNLQNKPDVESISGLSPAIAIDQKTTSHNPRSTVGTVTEIYDYLRLLYARIGVPYSPATGLPIESQTVSQMADRILALPEGTKLHLLAPIVRGQKGEHRKLIQEMQKRGFTRLRVNGEVMAIDAVPALDKNKKHDIEVVVDRLVIRPDIGNRLPDSLEIAIGLADGLVFAEVAGEETLLTFSAKFACPVSGFTLSEIEPRLFSFNSPFGACPSCDGLGNEIFFDPELIIPDTSKALTEGAIAPWTTYAKFAQQAFEGLSRHYQFNLQTPFKELPQKIQEIVLNGSGDEVVHITYDDGIRRFTAKKPFEGVIHNLKRRFHETESAWTREELAKYQGSAPCEACGGTRLRPEALCVKVADNHIGHVCSLSIEDACGWIENLPSQLTDRQNHIGDKIIREIRERLGFLNNVGLDYLTLARESGTLSGGESQRIRLASQIGSGLSGVVYVLDEPSIGLHQCDNERLLGTLRRLRDLGNTVIVVEHDEDTMRAADYLIDMGLGAGVHGGRVIAQGTPQMVADCAESVTGQFLSGTQRIEVPATRRSARGGKTIRLEGARANNLKRVSVEIPLGAMTCVTGVSGGGKSSLVIETLYRATMRLLHGSKEHPGAYDRITGLEYIDKVIEIDQSPIGRTPRSNPATYTGVFAPIRDWFAGLPEAKARGYKSGRFSFNVKGGRCEACQGDGVTKIEMHFLPDVYVECEVCKGKRYNRETLEVRYKDKSIADVLHMTVEDATHFFAHVPVIHEKMVAMREVGLDYIKLGQSATTLSGGEAQRVKLAKELSKRSTGKTLYILDEPTTGLHSADIRKLLEVLHRLVDAGNTMVIIEHNLDVIKTADHLLDIGPGGGSKGGVLVASGTPEQVAESGSTTGRFLKPLLQVRKQAA
jgi:excinuclease ABC subunit A